MHQLEEDRCYGSRGVDEMLIMYSIKVATSIEIAQYVRILMYSYIWQHMNKCRGLRDVALYYLALSLLITYYVST